MKLIRDGRFWAALAGLVVTVEALAVWELLRTAQAPAGRDLGLLAIMLSTLALTLALVARGRWLHREFQAAGDRLRMALESGHAVAWDWDVKSGRDVFVGDLQTMFGIDADARHGTVADFRHYVHEDDRDRVFRAVAEARNNRCRYNATFRLKWPDGTIRWVSAGGKFWYNPSGEAVRMLGVATDITERQLIEAQLRESEERFRLIADSAPVMLWMSGTDKLCTYFNRAWLEFTGRPIEAELGNGWAESVHPDDAQYCVATYEQAFDHRRAFSMVYRLRRNDDEYRWILDSGVPRFTPDGTFAGYAGSAIDVTTQKLAQTELGELNAKLMDAHESERTRIARELHDDIGQRIAVLTMDLDTLNRALPLPVSDLRERIGAIADQSIDLGRDIQAISHSLHSSKLDYMGIAAAAARFCSEMADRHSVAIVFTHQDVPADVSREAAICLYRVLQEAVTNAVRHAGVQSVAAALRASDDAIHLEVVDGGRGFDPDEALRGRGLGLVSMRERLSLVKGDLSITSRPGAGTTVRARVPLRGAGNRSLAALA